MARQIKTKKPKARAIKTPKPPRVKAKSRLPPVEPSDVELVRTSGSRDRGGGLDGERWVIMAEGRRAGTAYINMVTDTIRGLHASFHIFLNRPSQGRQIGRVAYRLGCESSAHDVIYAHMRKSNAASRLAALHAGFSDATSENDSQLVLVWRRTLNAIKDDVTDSHGSSGHEFTG